MEQSINFADTSVLSDFCHKSLDSSKALDIVEIDVAEHSSITDRMIICSGTSSRHVAAIADRLEEHLYSYGYKDVTICGKNEGQWVIVDANNVIVHILQETARLHYGLEELYNCMNNADESNH